MELLMEAMPAASTAPRLGTVTTVDGVRMVNVLGNNLLATWADPIVVDDGDSVDVLIYSEGVGQGRVKVTGRSTTQPRPRTASVTQVPAGSPTITITAAGTAYPAEPVGGPYTVGDLVHLDWGAGRPRVIGKVTLTPPIPDVAPPTPPPPPPPPAGGRINASAQASKTLWGPGGWGSWAGDGAKVHQGDYGSGPLSGAWFYGRPFQSFAGRPVTRIQFRTGSRLLVGNHGAAATFNFYAHTSPSPPGGDVARVAGPHAVTIQPGEGPKWIDLPLSFAAAMVAGGGIAIFGGTYAGMAGVTSKTPDSGAIIMQAR